MREWLKENKTVLLIILVFIFLYFFFFSSGLWWDSAVYLGMGKSIFSSGNSGLWEASRPLVWPAVLGFIWKIGLSPVIFGKLIGIIFSIGCIYLTYLIGKECFNHKVALLASFFVAFTPVFFLESSKLLTGIPSTFFGLAAFYLFFKKRYFYAGLFAGLAFMTRFLQLLIFIFLIVFLIFISVKKNLVKNLTFMFIGFCITVIPYLVLNLILYDNIIYPFLMQIFLTKYTGWQWWEPLSFYFINLIKQNFLVVFALIGGYLILRNKKRERMGLLAFFIVFFIFYNLNVHKETRFIITFLPYLYLITAYGIFYIIDSLGKKKFFLLWTVIIIWMLQIMPLIEIQHFDKDHIFYFDYIKSGDVSDGLWISNPVFIIESDKKAELIYYPGFDSSRAKELQTEILDAKHILLRTCDIPCPPRDSNCPAEKGKFIDIIKSKFQKIYEKKEKDCEYYIFTSSLP